MEIKTSSLSNLTKKRPAFFHAGRFFSGLFDELFPAFGAGNGDLALSPGNPDGLMAFWAVEIPVLLVPVPIQADQKLPVFLVTLVMVPGEAPEQGPDQHGVATQSQHQIHQLEGYDDG